MKKIFTKTIVIRQFLLVIALLGMGAGQVWGDRKIVDGGTISTGWETVSGGADASNKITGIGSTDISATSPFTKETNYLKGSKWSAHLLRSTGTISLANGETIEIGAQGIGSSSGFLAIRYSATSKNKNSTFTNIVQSITTNDAEFSTCVFSNLPTGDYYLQVLAKGVNINSVVIKSATTPSLSVSPSSAAAFGSVAATPATKTYTVTNNGAGTMAVNISNSNTTDFTISTTSLTDIGAGESKTFTIGFNYDAEDLGEKSATITVTPTYDGGTPVEISATATALSDNDPRLSVTPDETCAFGDVTATGQTKTYTVTNSGTGTLDVDIASDNTDYFTVSTASITGLKAGQSETFTVSYVWTADVTTFGEHSGNITVTPSYDESAKVTIATTGTSTAAVILDENATTTWSNGTNNVWMKYQPSNGWNTLLVPFGTSSNYKSIFGSTAKGYTLSSYSNGVLTFSALGNSYLGANNPLLVYVENAPDNSNGVLINNVYVFSAATAGSTIADGATFQGTYAPKTFTDANEDGIDDNGTWYGVTPSGNVMKAGTGASIKGYRAYFTGVSAPTNGARVSIVIEDENGGTTDLGFTRMVDPDAQDVYTLSGQKVQRGSKGIYIVNGRKVVIK